MVQELLVVLGECVDVQCAGALGLYDRGPMGAKVSRILHHFVDGVISRVGRQAILAIAAQVKRDDCEVVLQASDVARCMPLLATPASCMQEHNCWTGAGAIVGNEVASGELADSVFIDYFQIFSSMAERVYFKINGRYTLYPSRNML